jgi:hemoglobin/transferrin/lactoferrin receptor protein
MAHIPPMFGNTMIKYTTKRTFFQFDVRYNGWKEPGDMSPYGEDNEEEATPHGYPAWYTLNAKAAYNLGDNMFIQLAIDNILDYYYKTFASGISAPGRSFVISLKYSI